MWNSNKKKRETNTLYTNKLANRSSNYLWLLQNLPCKSLNLFGIYTFQKESLYKRAYTPLTIPTTVSIDAGLAPFFLYYVRYSVFIWFKFGAVYGILPISSLVLFPFFRLLILHVHRPCTRPPRWGCMCGGRCNVAEVMRYLTKKNYKRYK